ncbi:tetratricopeptide repeat-containing sensor histidine kinase [Flavobacterium sp. SM2513]|uniref:tetratricopeptide repeat-containing sensor histidine kinase n=1 Tax=Flavobacterium sp. SM2513 TaxID=3424766 RepID=UPI003D7F9205
MSRMKNYSVLVVFFLFANVFAQESAVDSLQQVLKNSKDDIETAKVLNELASAYQDFNPVLLKEYAQKALVASRKIDFALAEGTALLNLGNAGIISGNYAEALAYFQNAQIVFEKELQEQPDNQLELKNGLARAYGSMGIVFSEQNSYAKALQNHLKALQLYEETSQELKVAQVSNNIGVVYQSQNQDFKALEYFLKCFKIQEKNKLSYSGITATNIGKVYLNQKNFAEALAYFQLAEKRFEQFPDARGLGELYNNLGRYFQQRNNKQDAVLSFDRALFEFQKIDDKFGTSDTYFYLGQFYFEQNDYQLALENTQQSLVYAKELDLLELVQNSELALSTIYEKMGQTNASLKHLKLYGLAKDRLQSQENIRQMVQAEMNFEFDKKESLLQKEQEKKDIVYQEEIKRHQMQIFFSILFVILVFGIVFLIYNRMQLKKTLTLQKELAEYEQKALHLQMNPHFVFNCLGSISSFIVQNGTDSAIKYLAKFSKLMRLTLEYSKEALIPIDKEIESLQNYLELEQLRFNQVFDFTITKSSKIEDDLALPPLLLQPFVENAIIHGLIPKQEKGTIAISFELEGETLLCTIIDNGVGLEASQKLKEQSVSIHKSMALDITKKRLEMMETTTQKKSFVTIDEVVDENGVVKGTKVVLHLPVQYL